MKSNNRSPAMAEQYVLPTKLSGVLRHTTKPGLIFDHYKAQINSLANRRDALPREEKNTLNPIANLSGLDLDEIQNFNLGYCVFDRAGFYKGHFTNVRFTAGSLRSVNFSDSVLKRVSLMDTDLTAADFRRAVLDGVILDGADVAGADFTRATFKNCSLIGVRNLDQAIGLPPEIIAVARQAAFGPRGAAQLAAGGAAPE